MIASLKKVLLISGALLLALSMAACSPMPTSSSSLSSISIDPNQPVYAKVEEDRSLTSEEMNVKISFPNGWSCMTREEMQEILEHVNQTNGSSDESLEETLNTFRTSVFFYANGDDTIQFTFVPMEAGTDLKTKVTDTLMPSLETYVEGMSELNTLQIAGKEAYQFGGKYADFEQRFYYFGNESIYVEAAATSKRNIEGLAAIIESAQPLS